ncbi:phenolpthiocerol synthesis polyketide synthase ppsB [Penicillium atrosanguineum]|uniref:phenolpthiocerol synthesis polyketide synthase ppsB n=1 Tax=Penicillium atrosanguineum TaxID=1132637 RepID=UPI0023A37943|nr:phenolpthiocerol synthesis polyketide synthase ppsB [Penicillium atrosanguineum]KAJ5296403.1 phenolpthiocerol synthesis polyketide synthase ppsB [Penicillium atrosanguineum]
MTTTTTSVLATATACGASVYQIPMTDAACAAKISGNMTSVFDTCCKGDSPVKYDSDCGIYCLAQEQTVAELTDCLQSKSNNYRDVFCQGKQNATATVAATTTKTTSTSTNTHSGTGTSTSTNAAGVNGVIRATLDRRVQDGVAQTPPMGWNTYNHYSCSPNESIVHSNAKALVDLGLADLGYRYVTTDCGWTVADRTANGSLTWNETIFPSGFAALGEYIHDLGLLFGVYEDAGIRTCQVDIEQVGSLYHEVQDADTFASWGVDALKYDNCFSDAATGYPNVEYTPSTSPRARYANMTNALSEHRAVLFQICEWGVDFPALWAPSLGHTWRIGNDIIPAWRAIFRTLNQAVPNTPFAGAGQWPDLDMLEVGTNVLTIAEEQTHFSMWAILKSPLTIGGALKDEVTSIGEGSLAVLKNKAAIGFNQDALGVSAVLRRRWTEEGYEVWSGELEGRRIVAALINWNDVERELTLDLPDVGVQYAGTVKDVWADKVVEGVQTSYTSTVAPHGVILLELSNTTQAGTYSAERFATKSGNKLTFSNIYANTTSSKYTISIAFSRASGSATSITLRSPVSHAPRTIRVPASSETVQASIFLTAGTANGILLDSTIPIESIQIQSPTGTYYGAPEFALSGSTSLTTCGDGYCKPVRSKIGYLNINNTASITVPVSIPSNASGKSIAKYVEVDYINNDIALSTSWGYGSNSRNLTISLNSGDPVRLEVPLSGRHSELYGPGLGWWDPATLGLLLPGWKNGNNTLVLGNDAAVDVSQTYAPDIVGMRVFG